MEGPFIRNSKFPLSSDTARGTLVFDKQTCTPGKYKLSDDEKTEPFTTRSFILFFTVSTRKNDLDVFLTAVESISDAKISLQKNTDMHHIVNITKFFSHNVNTFKRSNTKNRPCIFYYFTCSNIAYYSLYSVLLITKNVKLFIKNILK